MTLSRHMTGSNGLIELWALEDSITTAVEANGHTVWRISAYDGVVEVELTERLDDESASSMCGQFPLTADYCGEGDKGAIFTMCLAQ